MKRESGENPERTGHCIQGGWLHLPLHLLLNVRREAGHGSVSQETCLWEEMENSRLKFDMKYAFILFLRPLTDKRGCIFAWIHFFFFVYFPLKNDFFSSGTKMKGGDGPKRILRRYVDQCKKMSKFIPNFCAVFVIWLMFGFEQISYLLKSYQHAIL